MRCVFLFNLRHCMLRNSNYLLTPSSSPIHELSHCATCNNNILCNIIGSDHRVWNNRRNTCPATRCHWCLRSRRLCLQIKFYKFNNHRVAHDAISDWCQYSRYNLCARWWYGKLCLLELSGGHILYVWPFWTGKCRINGFCCGVLEPHLRCFRVVIY